MNTPGWIRAALPIGLALWLGCGAAPSLAAPPAAPPTTLPAAPPAGALASLTNEGIAATYFKSEEIEQGRSLGNHRAACFALDQAIGLLVLAGLAFSAPGRRAIAAVRGRFAERPRAGLAAEVLLACGAVVLASLPLHYYRGFVLEHQLGLSTQTTAGWLQDFALEAGIGYGIAVLAVVLVDAVQRWSPRRWWLFSWGGLTAGIIVFFYLHPLLIAPLFNTYRQLEPGPLRDGCTRIAREAGIPIAEVYVMDASRRTRRFNAYFTGVGSTRSIALNDTLVGGLSGAGTLAVVGHEAGHWVHHHLARGMIIASLLILILLGFASRPSVLGDWPLSRPGALVRALLLILVFQVIALPLESTLSRAMEAQADEEGLRLSRDPDATVTMLVALARSNISNLLPHPLIRACLFSHPPIPERIRMALEAKK